jgi:hypothetical protein
MLPGMMPILHSPGVSTPGQVEHRNALGDGNDQRHFGVNRFHDGRSGELRRHVDHRRIGAGPLHRFRDRVEHRQADVGAAAFARRDAADHLRPVGERLLGVEGAGVAGHPLGDDLGVRVDENAHWSGFHTLKDWRLCRHK